VLESESEDSELGEDPPDEDRLERSEPIDEGGDAE